MAAPFDGAIGKDVVSRAWRKVRTDWEAWNGRNLHDDNIVRLILDGTVVRAKIDRKETAISLLAAIGCPGRQKVLLALTNDNRDMIYAETAADVEARRRARRNGAARPPPSRRPGRRNGAC